MASRFDPPQRMHPRWKDERILRWIARRVVGESSKRISVDYDVTEEAVRHATKKVWDHDAALSGEDVKGAYW